MVHFSVVKSSTTSSNNPENLSTIVGYVDCYHSSINTLLYPVDVTAAVTAAVTAGGTQQPDMDLLLYRSSHCSSHAAC